MIPVSDVDRAKQFYLGLGWRLDADADAGDGFRIVQLNPPGLACSVQFGTGVTSATPGSAKHLYLVVPDVEAARNELVARGVAVGESSTIGRSAIGSTRTAASWTGARPRHPHQLAFE